MTSTRATGGLNRWIVNPSQTSSKKINMLLFKGALTQKIEEKKIESVPFREDDKLSLQVIP